ncbi:putative quinol monooxygenase [Flavobacterium sp. HSC-61S13]|uniref:putative quinol monooxygenase n=1 Tax=Flavobacterium sp. HSC-61S13 TaxID=2910963 RepID=UPI00209D50F5|nr:antibiotic biosynthesis monooxygenase family protein [Flavobacterium sp. HSC-61S13]MCP1995501.1 quinol monooxygenase YgiN [Flavobacterium sp. HSC-61S13]
MFVRIVKMSFHEEKIPVFLAHFDTVKEVVRHYPGNQFLELYQDKENPSIFFTYSYWGQESDLEDYRKSETFREIWSFVKTLFNDKPQAWSVDKIVTLP